MIGNFGAGVRFGGVINAFTDRGELLGQLRMPNGQAISIDGLWSIRFGAFQAGDPDALYLTAGHPGREPGPARQDHDGARPAVIGAHAGRSGEAARPVDCA